jgi:hypothetical protein
VGSLVYFSCAIAALVCAILLLRAHRRTRARLLLWSAICFVLLTISNGLVVVDLLIFPQIDLFIIRNLTALAGVACLLWGLIWDSR